MEITKLSTRGQIVIPEKFRRDLDEGTAFVVTRQNSMIILKKIEGLTKEELKEMKELDKIWEEIDEGKGISMKKEEFLKEMNAW